MEKTNEAWTAELAETPTTQGIHASPTTGTERILADLMKDEEIPAHARWGGKSRE